MSSRFKLLVGKQLLLYILVNIVAFFGGVAFVTYSDFGKNLMDGFMHSGPQGNFIASLLYYFILFPFMMILVVMILFLIVILFVVVANILFFTGLFIYYGKQKITEEALKKEADKIKQTQPENTTQLKEIESKLEETREKSSSVGFVFKAIGIIIALIIAKAILFGLIGNISDYIKSNRAKKEAIEQQIELISNAKTTEASFYPTDQSNMVYKWDIDSDNFLWVLDDTHLSKIEISSGKPIFQVELKSIQSAGEKFTSFFIESDSDIWLYGSEQIIKYNTKDKAKKISLPASTYGESYSYHEQTHAKLDKSEHFFFFVDSLENIYLRMYGDSYHKWNGKKWLFFEIENHTFENRDIYTFLDSEHNIWACNYTDFPFNKSNGVYKVSKKDFSLKPYTVPSDKNTINRVKLNTSIQKSPNETFWISTDTIYNLSPPNKLNTSFNIKLKGFTKENITNLNHCFHIDPIGGFHFAYNQKQSDSEEAIPETDESDMPYNQKQLDFKSNLFLLSYINSKWTYMFVKNIQTNAFALKTTATHHVLQTNDGFAFVKK